MKRFAAFIKKLLFNERWKCNLCGKEIFSGFFCPECEKKINYNDKNICNRCGRKTAVPEEYCDSCKNIDFPADKVRSALCYDKTSSILIQNFKYNGKKYLAEIFSEFISNVYFKNFLSADFITFVPMSVKEKKNRGFNQSELLAIATAERIGLPVKDILLKTRETDRQAKLNREERLKNLRGAFKVTDKKEVSGKKVLLIDDVFTTGATSLTISGILKKAGADKVTVLTVASVPNIRENTQSDEQ